VLEGDELAWCNNVHAQSFRRFLKKIQDPLLEPQFRRRRVAQRQQLGDPKIAQGLSSHLDRDRDSLPLCVACQESARTLALIGVSGQHQHFAGAPIDDPVDGRQADALVDGILPHTQAPVAADSRQKGRGDRSEMGLCFEPRVSPECGEQAAARVRNSQSNRVAGGLVLRSSPDPCSAAKPVPLCVG